MVDIVPSYHRMQFQGKLIIQTWENSKKPKFVPAFGPLGPNLALPLDILVSYHHVQYQKKLMTNDPILRKLSDVQGDG